MPKTKSEDLISFTFEDLAEHYDFEEGGLQTIVFYKGAYRIIANVEMEDPDTLKGFSFRLQRMDELWDQTPEIKSHRLLCFHHRFEEVLEPSPSRTNLLKNTEPILTSSPDEDGTPWDRVGHSKETGEPVYAITEAAD